MFLHQTEVKNMRGGVGSVLIEKQDRLPVHVKMYNRITVLPHSSIGVHTHTDDEEIIYILKGKAQVLIDGVMYPLEEGNAYLTKKGENHSVVNNSEELLVMLAVITE